MGTIPNPGQKQIPISEWRRFQRVADWWDRVYGFAAGVVRKAFGFDMIVKTPSGGIAARSGTTIYGVECTVCVECETATAGQKTIVETSSTTMVFNFNTEAVAEEIYVTTGLTWKGTRHVTVEPC